MYCQHYGFTERPFEITPDAKFLYMTRGHREALATLIYGIRERRGFIAMVGDVGTGKTTLLRAALRRLGKMTKSAFIFNSEMPFDQVLLMILDDLCLLKPGESLPPHRAVKRLYYFAIRWFARGGNLVIAIDEAQNFSRKTLESFRQISNLETDKHRLIQIVLAGQTELDQRLDCPELRSFVQRINLKRYVKPLSQDETYAYLDHRLKKINYQGPPLFDLRAKQLIWHYSKGVPRMINNVCENALLIGYGTGKRQITGHEVGEAIKDLTYSPSKRPENIETKQRKIIPFLRAANN